MIALCYKTGFTKTDANPDEAVEELIDLSAKGLERWEAACDHCPRYLHAAIAAAATLAELGANKLGSGYEVNSEAFMQMLKVNHSIVVEKSPSPCFYRGEKNQADRILETAFPGVATRAYPLFVELISGEDAHQLAEILHWLLLGRARPQLALGILRDAMARGALYKSRGRWVCASDAFDWVSSVLGAAYTFSALRKAAQGAKLGERSCIRDDGTHVIKGSHLKQTVGAVSEVRARRVPCSGPGDGQPCRCGAGGVAVKYPSHVVVFAADASFEARQAVALETLAAGLRVGVHCIKCAKAHSEGDDTAVPVNVRCYRCPGLDGEPCENGRDGTPANTTYCLVLEAADATDAARELAASAAKDREARGFGCSGCASKLSKRLRDSGQPNAFAASLQYGKPCLGELSRNRGDGSEFVFYFKDADESATAKLFTEIEGTGCTHSRDEIEKNLTDWEVRIYKTGPGWFSIKFSPQGVAKFIGAAAAAALYVQKYDPATSGARPSPETSLAKDTIPGMRLDVDRLANNGVVRIDTLGKLAAVDVNNFALLEALKFSAKSQIYDSRNALWKMKCGAHFLLGLQPALAKKPPPLPRGLTKAKKRSAAARGQMASDEESPKSKKQRAAPAPAPVPAPSSSSSSSVREQRLRWTPDEDAALRRLHAKHGNTRSKVGESKWDAIAAAIGTQRTASATEQRWKLIKNKNAHEQPVLRGTGSADQPLELPDSDDE